MRGRSLIAVLSVSCLLFVLGCGGDDGGGPNPVTGVDITPDKANLEIGHSTSIAAKVTGGDNKSLTWTVNGIENGNSTYGTITQNSPVTYNAPDALPSPRTVVIGAVSVADTSKVDTCRIAVQFTKLFVDSATGDDDTATGCINIPYRTITAALDQADAGWTVYVMPGTYTDTDGETFPIWVRQEVSLVGHNWETCIIRKQTAEFDSFEGIRSGGNAATVRKLTYRDDTPPGNARSYHSLYTATDNALFDSIRVFERGQMACVRITGTNGTVFQNCVFDVTGDPTEGKAAGRGFEVTRINQGTIIRNCVFSGFHTCLFFNGTSEPLVEGCVLENCSYGAEACCNNSPDHTPIPDFGGGPRGSAGGNIFRSYSECGLINKADSTVYARFNTWHSDPPVAGEDFCVTGDGSIVVW